MASKILVGTEVIITNGAYKRKQGIITDEQPINGRQFGKKPVKIGEKTVWIEARKLTVIESDFPTETLSASAPLRERERNTKVCKEESRTLTSAQESGQDSHWQQLDLVEYLNSQDSVKEKSSAVTSSVSDFQELKSTQTCDRFQPSDTCTDQEELTFLPLVLHVNPLPEKVNGLAAQTSETASPQSLMPSADTNPDLPPLKMSQDSLTVPTDHEQQCFTSVTSWENFTASGTMQNGKLSAADGLEQFGEETDSLSLPRPGALSTDSSRVPGQTKFESKCKELGLIQKGEVADPEVLEAEFGLPIGWTDPSESRAATELLESEELHLETASTPDLQRSLSGESSICTVSQSDDEEAADDEHKETCPECGAILPPPTSLGGICCLYCDWELPELKLLEPGEQWVDTKLIVVGELQYRSKESQQHIDDLSSAMQTEDLWDWQRKPLIELWQDAVTGVVRCADGNHRTKAAIKAGITRVYAIVHRGSLNDAIASSCTANADSILPLTSQDHRRRTEIFLDLLDSCTDSEKLALLKNSKYLSESEKNRGVWSVRVINKHLRHHQNYYRTVANIIAERERAVKISQFKQGDRVKVNLPPLQSLPGYSYLGTIKEIDKKKGYLYVIPDPGSSYEHNGKQFTIPQSWVNPDFLTLTDIPAPELKPQDLVKEPKNKHKQLFPDTKEINNDPTSVDDRPFAPSMSSSGGGSYPVAKPEANTSSVTASSSVESTSANTDEDTIEAQALQPNLDEACIVIGSNVNYLRDDHIHYLWDAIAPKLNVKTIVFELLKYLAPEDCLELKNRIGDLVAN